MTEETNPELEQFRQRWREEVTARSKGSTGNGPTGPRPKAQRRLSSRASETARAHPPSKTTFATNDQDEGHERDDFTVEGGYQDLENTEDARRLGDDTFGIHPSNHPPREPRSALEHYEKGVEREAQGKLGDSLKHYRKAYRVGFLLKFHHILMLMRGDSSTTKSTKSTETSTFHLRPQNLLLINRAMPHQQSRTRPTTPSTGPPPLKITSQS